MTHYIKFTLSYNTYLGLIEGLEELCEKSNNFTEIQNYFNLINILEKQQEEYFSEYARELQEEFGLNIDSNGD